jgi:predicted acylesterase/phospholipase RssA
MQLRLSLTISGAVALGAYEGGALAALLNALRPLVGGPDAPVRVDAIGAASAGSVTGLLAARALLEGLDPVEVMHAAWVKDTGIGALRGHGSAAPLSVDDLRATATTLLDPPGDRSAERQRTPVRLSFTLAALRGLDYTVSALNARQPVTATTYMDYFNTTLMPGAPIDDLTQPAGASMVDAVLASAANAMGFPPYLIDRRALAAASPNPYAAVENWPQSGQLWYTDGGTLANEPLGRTLDLTNPLDQDDQEFSRVQLLIHPHPTGAPKDDAWADPARQPTWLETLLRAVSLQRTQSLYADLNQVERTNSRIAWANDLIETLGTALGGLPAEQQAQVTAALSDVLGRMRGQRAALKEKSTKAGEAAAEPVDPGTPLTTMLREAIGTAANVGGRTSTAVEVISPLVLPDAKRMPVEKMLSGEFLFHFGGFLAEELRQADFDLGYASTLQWLRDGGLGAGRLDDASADSAMAAASVYQPGDSWRTYGPSTFASLSALDKLQALRLAAHVNRVVADGLLIGNTQR